MRVINAFSAVGRLMLLAALVAAGIGATLTGEGRLALLVVATAIGVTGVVLAIVGSQIGHLSGLDRGLRATGVAGTATVTALRPTSVRINGEPVLEIGLDVDVPSHVRYPATIKQRVPLFWGPLTSGAVVGVVVDPADRDHLAIDWDAAVPGPSVHRAPEPASTSPPGPADLEHILRVGRSARAAIISISDAGDMSELGLVEVGEAGDGERLMIVDMEVQQAGYDPYEVRVAHPVPERLVGRVGPRTTVRVAIDRDDDASVAIDWSSVGH